mgnify:CR=1 FL=1
MSLTIITAPAVKPVTLEQAKKHLRLDLDADVDDWLITVMIAAATSQAEALANRSLITRTLRLRVYAALCIELPKPPFANISSVKLIDEDGVETTLTTDDYTVDTVPLVPVLELTSLDGAKYVQVEYTAGYGSTAASVPESIRHWIMCRINTLYEYREAFVAGTFDDKPGAFIDGLLDPYRIVSAH